MLRISGTPTLLSYLSLSAEEIRLRLSQPLGVFLIDAAPFAE
jgi:hypothetical protein